MTQELLSGVSSNMQKGLHQDRSCPSGSLRNNDTQRNDSIMVLLKTLRKASRGMRL